MSPFGPQPYHPFQCQYLSENAFVHFGTVICGTKNDTDNVFIPKLNNKPLKRDNEKDVESNNFIETPSEGCICLEIECSNAESYFFANMAKWQEVYLGKNADSFADYLDTNFSQQDKENYFGDAFLGDVMNTIFFTPLVNMTPPVSNVFLTFVPGARQDLLESRQFNFFVDDKKIVPIAYVNPVAEKKLIQLLFEDYFFVFPYLFKDDLVESFLAE